MLTGIELMLKRMETHPEEFVGVNGGCTHDWYRAFLNVTSYLTDEERNAVGDALAKAHRDFFNGEVMRIMAGKTEGEGEVTAGKRSLGEMLQRREELTTGTISGFGGAVTLPYNPSYENKIRMKDRYDTAVAKGEGQTITAYE